MMTFVIKIVKLIQLSGLGSPTHDNKTKRTARVSQTRHLRLRRENVSRLGPTRSSEAHQPAEAPHAAHVSEFP